MSKNFFQKIFSSTPADSWEVKHWRMEEPERVSTFFPNQSEAREAELSLREQGFLTSLRQIPESEDGEELTFIERIAYRIKRII